MLAGCWRRRLLIMRRIITVIWMMGVWLSQVKLFFLDGNMAKDFNQLSPEELMRVRGVQLRYDLKPSHILKIFSNYEKRPENPEEWRIPFLKPFDPEKTEKEQTQLFEKVTKMPEVVHKYLCRQPDGKTEKGQTIRGYYKIHDTILELLLEDTNFDKKPYWTYDGFKARKIQSRLKDAAERFARSVLQVYLEGREVLATKHFKPFPDIFAVYFLTLAYLYNTEPYCIRKLEKLYNPDAEWVKEIVDGVSRGDIASMQELINAICHRLIADVLGFSDSSTLQKVAKTFGQLLEWGRRHFNIISLRPEHLFGAGKLQKSVEIIQNSLARLEEIQSLVAYDTAMSLATSPFDMPWDYRTVYDREETVRYVLRQAQSGLSAKEIADKLGCETSHVKNILNVFRIGDDGQIEERSWTARLIGRLRENYENKLAALMAAPISVQALVGAAKAGIFFKGTQLALGTAMGTHQVAFFMTVLAPILQTVGFTATVAL